MRAIRVISAGLICSCIAMSAFAQSKPSFTTASKDCNGVKWSAEALEQYPNIAAACQSVMERDGTTYVKFEGKVVQNIDRGKQIKVDVKNGNTVTLTPPENLSLYIDGKKTAAKDLNRGDTLSFYIAQDRFVAQVPEEPPSTRLVLVPILYREIDATPERTAAALPSTASNLPLIGVLGLILVTFGATLTAIRRRR